MKYLKTINEVRQQLEIPFDGKHPLHGKPTHIHIVDALEDLSSKIRNNDPDNYFSSESIGILWDINYDQALKQFVQYFEGEDDLYAFIPEFPPKDFPEYYDPRVLQYLKKEEIDLDDEQEVIDAISDEFHMYGFLSDEGERIKDEEVVPIVFENILNENDVKWILEDNQDEDGLIPIWRAVTFDQGKFNDPYENIVHNYRGVGYYWSWDEDGAYPHGGSHNDDNTFILCAKVKPEYINWVQTIYKSAWHLREEKEVEVRDGVSVLIYDIKRASDNKSVKLNKNIIVPV